MLNRNVTRVRFQLYSIKKEETAFVFLSSHFKEMVRKSKNEVKSFQTAIHYHPGHPKLNTVNFSALIWQSLTELEFDIEIYFSALTS